MKVNKETTLMDAYKQADAAGKEQLVKMFGENTFKGEITDRVFDLESACKELALKPKSRVPYPTPQNDFEEAMNCIAERVTVAEALQEGKTGYWEPVFVKNNSGFGFSRSDTNGDATCTVAGLRLSFDSKVKSDYFGKLDIHNKFLTTKNK